MKVLVTGAAGTLGSVAVAALLRAGHEVRATDRRFRADLGVPLVVADLRDEAPLYDLLDGVDALVHLGNHPNRHAGPSPQGLIAENTQMNANAFTAALERGVRRIVFSSSVQVVLRSDLVPLEPHVLPYLPLDGHAPADPGSNAYAVSKHVGEELLRFAARDHADLAVTVLRYPMLVGEQFRRRFASLGNRIPSTWLHLGEATAHLFVEDAADIVARAVERQLPGYHQYFPAQTIAVKNLPVPRLIERFYPSVTLTRDLEQIESLIDISELERDLGCMPRERLEVEFA